MPYTTLVSGTTITASWANANVRDQGVTPFASASARASAIASPVAGMMTYLVDVARLDIWDGSAWQPFGFAPAWLYARRTSDLPRASTTTVVADPVLSVTVLPNAVYDLDCKLPYAATTTGDLKIGWVVPSGATLDWNINSAEGNATGGTSQTYWGWQNASGTDVAGGVGAGTAMECRPFGTLVTSSSGGTFALAWAQANSDSTATVLKTNASMTLTRRV